MCPLKENNFKSLLSVHTEDQNKKHSKAKPTIEHSKLCVIVCRVSNSCATHAFFPLCIVLLKEETIQFNYE